MTRSGIRRRALVAGLLGLALLAAVAAMPVAEAADKTEKAHVARKAPVAAGPASGSTDDDGSTVGIQINPTSGASKNVVAKVTVDDDNGHNDIRYVNMTVLKTDNSTVHVAKSTAVKESGSGKRGTFTYTFAMDYHADPGTYYVKVEVLDRDGDAHTIWTSFTYTTLAALTLSTSTIRLNPNGSSSGGVTPGQDTHGSPSSVTVTNSGNVPIDLQLSGTNLANGTSSIAVGNVHYSWNSNMSQESSLTTTATTNTTFDLAKGASSTKAVYFGVHIPSGTKSGVYTGTITIAAVQST